MFIYNPKASGVVVGTPSDDTILVKHSNNAMIMGGGGNDTIIVLTGNSTIYGTAGDTSSVIPLNFLLGTGTASFTTPPMTGVLGNTTIFGGIGNKTIYGDLGDSQTNIIFQTTYAATGQNFSSFFNFTGLQQVFGNDLIVGGIGNSVLVGDLAGGGFNAILGFPVMDPAVPSVPLMVNINGVLTMIVSAGGPQSVADSVSAISSATFWSTNNLFIFGDDTIIGSIGNNVITGDASGKTFDTGSGQAIATNGGSATTQFLTAGDSFYFGNDYLVGGTGKNSMYGEGQYLVAGTQGGVAIADGVGSTATVLGLVGAAPGLGLPNPISIFAGNDTIYGGKGTNTIFGDWQEQSNTIVGGTATATNGGNASSSYVLDGTQIVYGDDNLYGGGGKDLIVGDALTTTLKLVQGTAVHDALSVATVNTEIKNVLQLMGDDTIHAGKNGATIIGDSLDFTLLDSILSAGLVGSNAQVSDNANNTIVWGNDVLYAGSGKDNFVTTLALSDLNKLVTQGLDTIVDFNVAKDTLTFVGINNMSTLANHTTLSHSSGDTIINFDVGSITLQDVNVSSLADLHINLLPDSSSIHNVFHV